MPASGGFEVDPTALTEVSGTAHEQAERVRTYVKSMRGAPCPSQELFGEYGEVDTAFGGFLAAWSEEFGLTANALDEPGVKLAESATAYTRTDKLHTR